MSDTDNLIKATTEFSGEMLKKLLKKQHLGLKGWDQSAYKKQLMLKLRNHAHDVANGYFGQCVDTANLAMMLWHIDKEERKNL